MDILNFIDSKAIREHLHSINYEPKSSAEAAFIIWRSNARSLEEKFKAWEWIIENMEDTDTLSMFERAYYSSDKISDEIYHSLHKGLVKYIELTKKLIDAATKTEDKTVFSYEYYCHGDMSNCEDGRLFSSFDAVKKAMEKEKEKMTDYELECFYLKKQWIDVEEENEIVITFLPNWTIHEIYEKIDYKYTNDLLGGEVDYLNLFNEMWFAIPTPFKEGDILYRENTIGDKAYYENEDLFVLKNLCYWGYDDIESERKRHAWGDMDMLASGYFLYDDGRIYCECMHNYLALDYCEEELTGRTRTLKAISNYIKGNIDLRELLDAYAIITQEERIAERRKGIGVLDEYMMLSGLKDETVTNSLSKYIEHFYPGKLYTIAGRPGMGKSTVALNLAKEIKEHKRIEATYIQCEKVTSNELEFCLRGVADYKYVPEITIEQVEEIIKKSANHIFFIDSFNHIKKDGSDRAIRLKEIADKYNAAIIVLTSVMHAPKHRNDNRPRRVDMVSNICDSLWNTSDAVVFLYRERYYNDNIRNDVMEFNVAKADQETGMFKLDYKRLLREWRIERVKK